MRSTDRLAKKNSVPGDGRWKSEWAGFGCGFCHNGMLEYKGTRISISGSTKVLFVVS
jgi:hypothetical protein